MKHNQKGSTSVFLVLILAAMLGLAGAFIYAAKETARKSHTDGLFDLAGKSVLSEFDIDLKNKYGLFAFSGSSNDIEGKLRYYMDYSFALKENISFNALYVNAGGHSLGDTSILEKEILDYMKYVAGKELLKEKETSDGKQETTKDRVLRNRKIINNLPSLPLKNDQESLFARAGKIGETLTSVENVFREGSETYLINQYILSHFKNASDQNMKGDTFFSNEVEYILEGDYRNKENLDGVKYALIALRSALNVSYLYADSDKRMATLAMAELMTPGPEAILTQAVIVGTWAYAEAKNDVALLMNGRKVPFFKDDASWATDLDAVMNNKEKDYIEPAINKGLSYKKYLMVFLHFQDKSVKLARVMDLIQINMKGTCNGDFSIKAYHVGFQYRGKINRNEHEYRIQY